MTRKHVSYVCILGILLLSLTGGAAAYEVKLDDPQGQATFAIESEDNNETQDFPLNEDGASGGVPIEVEMYEQDFVTVTFGDLDGQNVRFDATVRDTDDSGTAIVYFDPQAFDGPSSGFSAGEGTELVATDDEFSEGLPSLATGRYDVFASAGDTAYYESGTEDRSFVSLQEYPPEGSTYQTVSLIISEVPTFEITETELGATALTVDETLQITVTVANTGNVDGPFDVTLTSNDEVLTTETVSLATGDEETVTFEQNFSEPGAYEIRSNDIPIGNVTVEEETETEDNDETDDTETDDQTADDDGTDDTETDDQTADDDETDDTETDGQAADDDGPGFGLSTVVSAFVVLGYILTRRKTDNGKQMQ